MTRGAGPRVIVDLEKGKPTRQIGKALSVLQAIGLALATAPIGGHAVGARNNGSGAS